MSLKEHNTATYHQLDCNLRNLELLTKWRTAYRTLWCSDQKRLHTLFDSSNSKYNHCNMLIGSSSSMTNLKSIQNLLVTSRNHSQSTQMNQVDEVLAKVMNYATNIQLTDIRLSMSISWMHRKTAPDSPSPSMSMSSCIHTPQLSLRNEHI